MFVSEVSDQVRDEALSCHAAYYLDIKTSRQTLFQLEKASLER